MTLQLRLTDTQNHEIETRTVSDGYPIPSPGDYVALSNENAKVLKRFFFYGGNSLLVDLIVELPYVKHVSEIQDEDEVADAVRAETAWRQNANSVTGY